MTKLRFLLELSRSILWVRPVILSLAAVSWVGLSLFADWLLPVFRRAEIEKTTLVNLFSILASSMLTVATFSVAAVAAAFGAVAASASPRATGIVMGDTRVQSTLAAFLAAFIYAVVSITALSALNFGSAGRFMLFMGFVLLVSWVLISFLRWVDRISKLGKLDDTLDRVTRAAKVALTNPDLAGRLGGLSGISPPGPGSGQVMELVSGRFGYIQHVDMEALQAVAEKADARIRLDVRPGSFITRGQVLGIIETGKRGDPREEDRNSRGEKAGGSRRTETRKRTRMTRKVSGG